jgi:hypothetical protein
MMNLFDGQVKGIEGLLSEILVDLVLKRVPSLVSITVTLLTVDN